MKAVFLDRDGVINKYPGDFKYVTSWKEFFFLPRIKPALKRLNAAGFKLFVISNQAGVSKGLFTQETLNLITENMLQELNRCGIVISGVHYCTHRQEDNCPCRKPKTGLVDKVIDGIKKQGKKIDLRGSFIIGDTIRDMETGKTAGIKTILIFSGKEKLRNKKNWHTLPDFTAQDLSEAADLILNPLRRPGLRTY